MSVQVLPGRNDPRELVLRFHASNRDVACHVLDEIQQQIPPGYVWQREGIARERKPGKSSSGQRVSVTVVLFHNDSREPTFDEKALRDFIVEAIT